MKACLCSILVLLAPGTFAMTVTLVGDDFDGGGGPGANYSFGYEYSGYGPTTGGNVDTGADSTSSHSLLGVGNGGLAAETLADFSMLATTIPTPNNYAYDGFAVGVGFNAGAWTGANPVDDLNPGDLFGMYIEFDYFLAGADTGVSSIPGDLDLEFRTPDGLIPGDTVGGIDRAFSAENNPINLATGAWTTVSLPVLSLAPSNATSFADFDTWATQVTQI